VYALPRDLEFYACFDICVMHAYTTG